MPIIETSFEQQSSEWFHARLGNVGASSMKNIITSQGKPSKSAEDYMYKLAGEIIRGEADDTFKSEAMEIGNKREQESRDYFEFLHEVKIDQCAMVYKDERKLFHCSPDGLIGSNEGLEVKNPLAKTHVKYLLKGNLPVEYFVQVQGSLYVTERKFWWFMSYVPNMKPFILKVERDDAFIAKLGAELESFCEELQTIINKIK